MGRLAGAGQRPEAHAEAAWAVAWRAGGGGLLTGAADGAVKFWRYERGRGGGRCSLTLK